MPRLHERFFQVRSAENEIGNAVFELAAKHDITSIELLQILTTLQQTEMKFMLREERHPEDTDRKADEA